VDRIIGEYSCTDGNDQFPLPAFPWADGSQRRSKGDTTFRLSQPLSPSYVEEEMSVLERFPTSDGPRNICWPVCPVREAKRGVKA
jgi:hypothetical protein